jgi:biopolymer transport protein ExbD
MGRADSIVRRLIEHAASRAPTLLVERLREEWMADLSDRCGRIARLRFVFGCYWAAILIKHEFCAGPKAAAGTSTIGEGIAMSGAGHGMSAFSRQVAVAGGGEPAICEINTTPLIDILLVLLVTLIVSLPIMTHAVKLDMPQSRPPNGPAPEVIDLDIDFDGTISWNGSPVANLQQLEGYFRTESHKHPQPEVHLRPDPHAKYDVVAKVLAAGQRNGMTKLGFITAAEFAH